MWIPLIGVVVGIVMGLLLPVSIPAAWTKYTSVAVLAALDTGVGGIKAGLEHHFSLVVFGSGFTFNILIATLLVYLGDSLGVDLYLAAILVFGVRLFNNTTTIRRMLIDRFWPRSGAQS
jgi:small basic protein